MDKPFDVATNQQLVSENRIYEGKCIFFNKSYGFLEWTRDGIKQEDLFVHYSDIILEGFKTLKKEQPVTFKIGLNIKGMLKAVEVVPSTPKY